MAIFEYRFTDLDGIDQTVERRFRMGEAPDTVTVQHKDVPYEARRILSLPASMKLNWEVKDMDTQLPPENYKGIL